MESDLTAGRKALLRCIAASEEFDEYLRESREDDDLVEGLRRALSRLYRALRNGWTSICSCWPAVVDVDRDPLWRDRIESVDMPARVPSIVWMSAKEAFWKGVILGGYMRSATEAWGGWVEVYVPPRHESLPPRILVSTVCEAQTPDVERDDWDSLKLDVRRHLEASATRLPSTSEQVTPPRLPSPRLPLPASKSELQRLLARVDQYRDGRVALLVRWKLCTSENAPDDWAWRLTEENCRLEPLLSDINPYLDPIATGTFWHFVTAARDQQEVLGQELEKQEDPQQRAHLLELAKKAEDVVLELYYAALDPIDTLRTEILAKLAEAEARTTGTTKPTEDEDEWISASQAEVLAKEAGRPLSLKQIGDLCRGKNPPFRFRKPAKNRLDIHYQSFALYLCDQIRSPADPDAESKATAKRVEEHYQKHGHKPNYLEDDPDDVN